MFIGFGRVVPLCNVNGAELEVALGIDSLSRGWLAEGRGKLTLLIGIAKLICRRFIALLDLIYFVRRSAVCFLSSTRRDHNLALFVNIEMKHVFLLLLQALLLNELLR